MMGREGGDCPPAWHSCQSHCLMVGGRAGVSQGWKARQDPWEALGSTVHLDKGGQGLGLARPGGGFGGRWAQTGLFQPGGTRKVWGPPRGVSTRIWPLHHGGGWTGAGKANQGRTSHWGPKWAHGTLRGGRRPWRR